jgi:glutamate synthase domain-containing protein 1
MERGGPIPCWPTVLSQNEAERALAPAQNLLNPRYDHDSCGTGFVAQVSGEASHKLLAKGLTALARLLHRGAVAADGKSSDGVGILAAIPRGLLLASTREAQLAPAVAALLADAETTLAVKPFRWGAAHQSAHTVEPLLSEAG